MQVVEIILDCIRLQYKTKPCVVQVTTNERIMFCTSSLETCVSSTVEEDKTSHRTTVKDTYTSPSQQKQQQQPEKKEKKKNQRKPPHPHPISVSFFLHYIHRSYMIKQKQNVLLNLIKTIVLIYHLLRRINRTEINERF